MQTLSIRTPFYTIMSNIYPLKRKGFQKPSLRQKLVSILYIIFFYILRGLTSLLQQKKGRIKPTFSLFLRCLLIKLQVRNIHRRRHEKFSYTASMFVVLSPRYYDYFRSFCILLPHPLTVCNAFFHLYCKIHSGKTSC